MLTQKSVDRYGVVAIVLMAVMLVLLWAGAVPRSMTLPLFLVAAALFLIRVTLRLILARQDRQQRRVGAEGGPPRER
ncbi:MAG: hypothetical protein AB1428_04805 [Bacteroidota bacterium]